MIIFQPFTLKCMCTLQTWTLVHGTKLGIFIPPLMFMDIEAISEALFAFPCILERKLWKFITIITLFIFITMFCGTGNIMRTDNIIILLVPHNIVMDMNDGYKLWYFYSEYCWDWMEFTCTKDWWNIYVITMSLWHMSSSWGAQDISILELVCWSFWICKTFSIVISKC